MSKHATSNEGPALRRRGVELLIGALAAALLTFAAVVYTGRVLRPAEYSDFAASLALIYIVGLALSPVVPAIARVAARHAMHDRIENVLAMRRNFVRIAMISVVVCAIAFAIALRPAAHWLRFRSVTPLLLANVTAFAYIVLSIDRGFLQGLFRFREYNWNVLIESVVRALLIFALLRRMPTAAFAAGAWTIGTLTAQLAAAWSLRARSSEVATVWGEFVELIRPMAVLMLSLAVFQNTDLIAVKRFMTAEDAGAYGAVSALARGFGALFAPLYAIAGPLLTRAREQNRSVAAATLKLTFAYCVLAAVPLVLLAAWPEIIVGRLFGPGYIPASPVLAPLCAITILSYAGLMLSQGLVTIGHYRFVVIYAIGAVAQMTGLALIPVTYGGVVRVLWISQGVTLLVVAIFFLNNMKMMRAGSAKSSA